MIEEEHVSEDDTSNNEIDLHRTFIYLQVFGFSIFNLKGCSCYLLVNKMVHCNLRRLAKSLAKKLSLAHSFLAGLMNMRYF